MLERSFAIEMLYVLAPYNVSHSFLMPYLTWISAINWGFQISFFWRQCYDCACTCWQNAGTLCQVHCRSRKWLVCVGSVSQQLLTPCPTSHDCTKGTTIAQSLLDPPAGTCLLLSSVYPFFLDNFFSFRFYSF